MRHAGRELLSLALMDARNHSLHLFAAFERALESGLQLPRQPGMEPPAWLAGHIGWLSEYWIARNPQRGLGPACPAEPMRLVSIDPVADAFYNPVLMPPAQRWQAELPSLQSTRDYLMETLEGTLELLHKAGDSDDSLYFFRAMLFHEDMRGEQLLAMAQAAGLDPGLALAPGSLPRDAILVPAGPWQLGAAPGGFVFGVEQASHRVDVPQFEIDAQPVSWAQFVEFVDDGGYDQPGLWQPAGWDWLQKEAAAEGRRGPRYVEQIGVASGAVLQTRFGSPRRMGGNQPAMHVSWWEADAWARWAGRRLPAEVEWEMAAHTAARRGFRWGEVREWTAGTLRPWPGHAPDPWLRGSDLEAEPQFGLARVLRGASFATRARMKHPKFRGFALPERDEGFTGFRTCAL